MVGVGTLSALLALVSLATLANGQACSVATTCRACLDVAPACQWCSDLNEIWQRTPRCATSFFNCTRVTNVQSQTVQPVTAVPLGDRVQVSPQRVAVAMRAHDSVTFNVALRPAENYPLDVYYLMDHSFSFSNDLNTLKTQASDIAQDIQAISNNFQIGFGSFVDKTVQPFVITNGLAIQTPCQGCKLPYSFENTFPLSNQSSAFRAAVDSQSISGNIDTAEGILDAMMQVLVCGEKIGWRQIARRVLVVATDAVYHTAGDGRLAGVVWPNNGQCQLGADNRYTGWRDFDYPSLGQLYNVVQKEDIFVVFAVTREAETEFGFVRNYIRGSQQVRLQSDSSNLRSLLVSELARLVAQARIQVVGEEGIRVTRVDATCPSGPSAILRDNPPYQGCQGLASGSLAQFTVTVEAQSCAMLRNRGRAIVRFIGFGDVEINVTGLCDCPCEGGVEVANSTWCNGQGAEQCGLCTCLPGFRDASSLGRCDCNTLDVTPCIDQSTGLECSDRGQCVCQQCQCNQPHNGTFCECDTALCGQAGSLCSGNGMCECETCRCSDGFSGALCDCPTARDKCQNPDGRICSGQGPCLCGICQCPSGYGGPLCEVCERSTELCEVEVCSTSEFCLNLYYQANMTQPFAEYVASTPQLARFAPCGGYPTLLSETVSMLPPLINGIPSTVCTSTDPDNCVITYYVVVQEVVSGTERVFLPIRVARERDCPIRQRSSTSFNYLPLILGIVFGLLFAGILMLLIWRIYTWRKDQQEYNKFLKAQKSTTWSKDQNPLFKAPTQEFNNPTYGS